MSAHPNSAVRAGRWAASALALVVIAGCSSNPVDAPPPTITPARAADSPAPAEAPAGTVLPLAQPGQAAVFDATTARLVVLSSGADRSTVTLVDAAAAPTAVELESEATAVAGDGDGTAYLATRGGYLRLDIGTGEVTRVDVDGQQDVEFTAITRRADGRVVLGSADGAVVTTSPDGGVEARLKMFARVDALVTQDDIVVVLDRGQTSVTTLNADGTNSEHALRAGDGATTMATDGAGRVLVADTRGDELLVYGVRPLILRQRYPVPDAPYGVAGSQNPQGLAWVAQTQSNTVVGYDLATGIPVEKVRYPTVQQPNSLAYADTTDTLYVVSGSGAGLQVITGAGGAG